MKICIDIGGGGMSARDGQMLYYMLGFIALLVIFLFVFFVAIPWVFSVVHSQLCAIPNWPVRGDCS